MPDAVTVEVEGLDEAIRRFGDTGLVRNVLKDKMHKSVKHLHGRVTTYPPPPPGSTYRRTDILKLGWTTKVEGRGADLTGRVGTAIPYARYVMGEGMQAAIHQGRWPTAEAIARDDTPQIIGYFSEGMAEIARRLAGQ